MFHLPLVTSGENISTEQFWNAVSLFHERPHLINRRIIGVTEPSVFKVNSNLNISKLKECFTKSAILYEILQLKGNLSSENLQDSFIVNIISPYDKTIKIIPEHDIKILNEGILISLRFLMPRSHAHKKSVEIVIFDKTHNSATFFAVSHDENSILAPPFPYDIILDKDILIISVYNVEDADSGSAAWLANNLFPKLMKWTQDVDLNVTLQPSLSLVSMEKYCNLYQILKIKYGIEIVKVWPEKTDPLKFVYEDVAIAAYLITLWQELEGQKKVNFVDLGCGNGLLVHILNEEGFSGFGIDVRRRKIWDFYPSTTNLKIGTITPSSDCLYPDADWIIGNHSDELTPWIPVIASRSSYNCKYFLLPCCCYEFNGKKYQRLKSSQSQYSEYIEYIKDISEKCGFQTSVDKLRIPSTKRKCLIGSSRSYDKTEFNVIDTKLTEFINERSQNLHRVDDEQGEKWISNFEARENVEKVRNCTQLDRKLTEKIVLKVFQCILRTENMLTKYDGTVWNSGTSISLPELVKMISREDLINLKKECGGLQTLLRNHHQIFEVRQGVVKIRLASKKGIHEKRKTRPCWFLQNHPNGCFYDDENCTYKHT